MQIHGGRIGAGQMVLIPMVPAPFKITHENESGRPHRVIVLKGAIENIRLHQVTDLFGNFKNMIGRVFLSVWGRVTIPVGRTTLLAMNTERTVKVFQAS